MVVGLFFFAAAAATAGFSVLSSELNICRQTLVSYNRETGAVVS